MKQITIAGNIGKDAVLRRTQNGDPVAGFSVAVSEGRDKPTTWFDCSLWGKRADALAQYLSKGTKLTVCGEFSTRDHEGKTYLQVRVSEITLQGGGQRSEGVTEHDGPQSSGYGAGGRDMGDSEIPFIPEVR